MVSQEPQLDQAAIWLLTFCWALARRTGTQAAQQSQGIATLLEVSPRRSLLLFLPPPPLPILHAYSARNVNLTSMSCICCELC